MSMENILELQQVSKTFSKSNFALENVTFSLPYGSIMVKSPTKPLTCSTSLYV